MSNTSEDDYVRVDIATLQNIKFVHYLSGLDENEPGSFYPDGAITLSGYTEWVSLTLPIITIGWDWMIDVSFQRSHSTRTGLPRSNLMLIDEQQIDIGATRSETLLAAVIDTILWENVTAMAIKKRYSNST